ncbi:molybdenum cofactor guanylyltransferase MobA [Halopseudomonas maritima]|uniref:molybdenum cofactor guanylyltransferase MobA n=1 Tax=Halopseudomonas maritima TaxID=2918528 RepID=UPI001EEC9635|nr:molybdenum cofactor guanylyltransferase MobA [Halopseudomonas maritima]UJJ32042.1 molybdenum cofactor guanylyltransferase [Halopseudomonas maritima]
MPHPFTLSTLFLAGGQGSRLGGIDKGLMLFRGEPVAARLSRVLQQVGSEVLISCNRNADQYSQWANRLVSDPQPAYPGPLLGVLSALRVAKGSHLLVVPCDMPLLDVPLLQSLIALAREHPEQAVALQSGQQLQPLVCVLPLTLLNALERAWQAGQRSPRRWLIEQQVLTLRIAEDDPRLLNANTPGEWETTSTPS